MLDIVQKESELLDKLPLQNIIQSALLLLRYCTVPKFIYLLRTVPTSLISEAANLHDSLIIQAFESIVLCGSLGELECLQLGLDMQRCGFGLRSATQSASEDFIGGWANTLHYLPQHNNRVRHLCDVYCHLILITILKLQGA